MNALPFRDEDPKLVQARRIAYAFLYQTRLRNPALGEHSLPRSLADTLAQEVLSSGFDKDIAEALEKTQPPEPIVATAYDPNAQAEQNRADSEKEREAFVKENFRQIFDALALLADTKQPILEPKDVENAKRILCIAPDFMCNFMIPIIAHEQVLTSENMQKIPEIARKIAATRLRRAKDPQAMAEFTRSDHENTRRVLGYMDEWSKALQLALNDTFTAVNQINNTFNGRQGGLGYAG